MYILVYKIFILFTGWQTKRMDLKRKEIGLETQPELT